MSKLLWISLVLHTGGCQNAANIYTHIRSTHSSVDCCAAAVYRVDASIQYKEHTSFYSQRSKALHNGVDKSESLSTKDWANKIK